MAKKLEVEGQEVIDTENLALCVSETKHTFGFGRRKHDEVVSINRENVEDNYRDSIVFPFGDICGDTCNGTEQGITVWVRVTNKVTCYIASSGRMIIEMASDWPLALMPINGNPLQEIVVS